MGTATPAEQQHAKKNRIEPYQPPHPTIRELMGARAVQTGDEGIIPNGYPGRPPKPAYREAVLAPAERHVLAGNIQAWRGEEQGGAQEASEEK